jgi:hypothetical protein
VLVIVCDRLFEQVMGIACGGPAEDREVQRLAGLPGIPVSTQLFERFDQSPRVAVSIYGVSTIATPVSP